MRDRDEDLIDQAQRIIDDATGEVRDTPEHAFAARLKGPGAIRRKDGIASFEGTFVVNCPSDSVREAMRPILALMSEYESGTEFEVVVSPMARQGRLW